MRPTIRCWGSLATAALLVACGDKTNSDSSSAGEDPIRIDEQGNVVTDQMTVDAETGDVTVPGLGLVFEDDGEIRDPDGTLVYRPADGCLLVDSRDGVTLYDCDDGGQRFIEARNGTAEPLTVTAKCERDAGWVHELTQVVPANGTYVVAATRPAADQAGGEPRSTRAATASVKFDVAPNRCRLGAIGPPRAPRTDSPEEE
jgi:hypothetical protein